MSPKKKSTHERRKVPWPRIVAFHKEIAERNEEGFFAKRTDDDQARDWSFVRDFQPLDMSGSWKFEASDLISEPFGKSLTGDQHEALFGGGPGIARRRKTSIRANGKNTGIPYSTDSLLTGLARVPLNLFQMQANGIFRLPS